MGFMFREIKRLNVSGYNVVEPVLNEGPLDFVGRYWERLRPRDGVIVITPHIGELEQPPAMETLSGGWQREAGRFLNAAREEFSFRSKAEMQQRPKPNKVGQRSTTSSTSQVDWAASLWKRTDSFASKAREEFSFAPFGQPSARTRPTHRRQEDQAATVV